MIYLVIFNLLILLRYALMRMSRMRGQIYVPLLILLFLFSAFRFEVGCDWTGYLNQFKLYSSQSFSQSIVQSEGLWSSLFVFQKWIGLPYPWINVFSSLIFFYGIHTLARRQPDALAFLVLTFPILIINMPMSGIRQGAAIGVMCIAFTAFTDRTAWKFIVFTIVASLLHNSAIVFILIVPLVSGNYSRQRIYLTLLLAIPGVLYLLSGEAAGIATARYVGNSVVAAGAVYRVGLLGVTALFFFLVLRRKWEEEFSDDLMLVFIGALIMIATVGLLPISSVVSDRFGYYLVPIQAVILARIPFFDISKNRVLYISLPYIGLLFIFAFWLYFSGLFQQCYIPYQSWLFGFPEYRRYVF